VFVDVLQRILVEHDEIGELADLERPYLLIEQQTPAHRQGGGLKIR